MFLTVRFQGRHFVWLSLTLLLLVGLSDFAVADSQDFGNPVIQPHHMIVFVWDGLRPDAINSTDTPNLAHLRDTGVNFVDHHSTYPTVTMINAASLATGAYPATHGFYGNSFWVPNVHGRDSANDEVNFSAPVFTEDYAILRALDRAEDGKLLSIPTLFEVARHAGVSTAIVGKGGPAFLQSRDNFDFFVDDKTVLPLSAATALNNAGIPLPQSWANAYTLQKVPEFTTLKDLAAGSHFPVMNDGITSDPSKEDAVTSIAVNAYQAKVFIEYVLPKINPQLAMLWLKNPDSTEHAYGPGSIATRNALHANDAILGALLHKLDELKIRENTNIIVVSDHGHSSVSGDLKNFPLRAINDGSVGEINDQGYSVSGEVRSADLLRRAGLLAFDGNGPQCNPVMSGIGADGMSIYTHRPVDLFSACKGKSFVTGSFLIPDAKYLTQRDYSVIADDGGSEYFYVPSHSRKYVNALINFLQRHKQYGAIFIDSRYGKLPGTLPLSMVHLQNAKRGSPDVVVSFSFDADASIGNVPGIEYHGGAWSSRGMHGSFSPRDVHNTLIASGPDFKSEYKDTIPSANVDVAPTIAHLLGLSLSQAEGRTLLEALRDHANLPKVRAELVESKLAKPLHMVEPTDVDGTDPGAEMQYKVQLHIKVVRQITDDKKLHEYQYFDSANVLRY